MLMRIISLSLIILLTANASADLVGHWKFDENSGAIAVDSSGNGNDGTLYGGPLWVSGKVGGALQFDGNNDCVQVNRSIQDDMTMMGWIKTATSTATGSRREAWLGSGLFWSDVSGTMNDFIVAIYGKKLIFCCGQDNTESVKEVVTGDWIHVAVTRKIVGSTQEDVKIYIDGELDKQASYSMVASLNANKIINIGGNTLNNRYYKGLIDDVLFYSNCLTQEDIAEIINSNLVQGAASSPTPSNGETIDANDVTLNWFPGTYAFTHNVFFGTSFNDVNNATVFYQLGTNVFPNLAFDVTSLSLGSLAYNTTYFWRVDEVNAPSPHPGTYKGNVWSFTTGCETVEEPVYFADANLKQAVKEALGITTDPTEAQMAHLITLTANNRGITNLTGLEYAFNLTYLSLDDNQINDLGPIPDLTKLNNLQIRNNFISDLSSLSGLINLQVIQLPGNQIKDLTPLSGLTNLTNLALNVNQISDISPLSGLTNLTALWLNINPLNNDAFCTYIPTIKVNNPGLKIFYNANSNPPSGVSATDGTYTDKVRITWNPVCSVTGDTYYQIYRSNTELGRKTLLGTGWLTGTNYDDTTAAGGQTYYYWLKAKTQNSSGTYSETDYSLYDTGFKGGEAQYILSISSSPGGSVNTPGEGNFFREPGALIQIEAKPDAGYQFSHWGGTAVDANMVFDPFDPNTSLLVNKDCSLSAYFTAQNEPWTYVYLNEFTSQPGPEWSHNLIDITPIGGRWFLGQFGNDTVTLTLTDLPPHVKVRLTFDLFIIRSWDGDGISGSPGPDLWSVKVNNDIKLLETTFDNHWFDPNASFFRQSFPYDYPGPGELPQTGAVEKSTLGYIFTSGYIGTGEMDSVYNLSFTIMDSSPSICFNFAGSCLQGITDESWGLDNVQVEILEPEPQATLSISSTAGGSVDVPGEGDFDFETGTNVTIQAVTDPNFLFTGWIGTAVDAGKVADPNSTYTNVTIDADYTLEATFIALSTTLYVNIADSNDPNQYGTEDNPISGIQDAIDVAQNGTKIVVAKGVYKGGLIFGDKDIYLIAQESDDPNDPNKVNHPIIVGDSNEPVIIFCGTSDANCIISGFTIKGVTNGIVCNGTNPVITNCIITGNRSYGIALYDSNATIVNCTITGNGGDLLGGGLGCWDSNTALVNCILWNNYPNSITAQSGAVLFVRYSNIEGTWPGENNLDIDPNFAEPGYWVDSNDPNIIVEPNNPNAIWLNGDYHLKSQAGRWEPIIKDWTSDLLTSLCIDAGDPNSPVGNEPEPNGNSINIGAYGGTAQASKSP